MPTLHTLARPASTIGITATTPVKSIIARLLPNWTATPMAGRSPARHPHSNRFSPYAQRTSG